MSFVFDVKTYDIVYLRFLLATFLSMMKQVTSAVAAEKRIA